jgi:trimeric autotransporter adhesin
MKTRIPPVLITFALVCVALVQNAQAIFPPPDGDYPGGNTAEGQEALSSLTDGTYNTAVGFFSLRANRGGNFNTAIGAGALLDNKAEENTAIGAAALLHTTSGSFNTATGSGALFGNFVGANNTANGFQALASNTIGTSNTATGSTALQNNQTGSGNTANGDEALFSNIAGAVNTANGEQALFFNTTGNSNTAIGFAAGFNQTTGSSNVYIGSNMMGTPGESNACYIASIFSQTSASGIPVLINSNNKLGTTTSSKRFKEDIKPMGKTSETLFALNPVTFRYKKEIDPAATSQLGLVAEDVEKVNPDLVVRDKEGKPYSVRYDQVNAMLLNEFLKEHRKNEQQEATIAELKEQIEALTVGLQKVSAQLEANKPAPQVVSNDQ